MRTRALFTAALLAALAGCGNETSTLPAERKATTSAPSSSTTAASDDANGAAAALADNEVGATGPAGPPGSHGPAGPSGPTGTAGISGREVVERSKTVALEGQSGSTVLSVPCPTGKQVLGGGARVAVTPSGAGQPPGYVAFVAGSDPVDAGWRGEAGWILQNAIRGQELTLWVSAICATVLS